MGNKCIKVQVVQHILQGPCIVITISIKCYASLYPFQVQFEILSFFASEENVVKVGQASTRALGPQISVLYDPDLLVAGTA